MSMTRMDRFSAEFLTLVGNDDFSPINRLLVEYATETSPGVERKYHTFEHVLDCIDRLDEYAEELGINSLDKMDLFMALSYHDAVYFTDPERSMQSTNEELSAEFAEKELTEMGFPETFIERVVSLILATDHSKELNDSPTQCERIIRDIDLAGLADDWDSFNKTSADVRHEFSCVCDEDYQKGRTLFMNKLVNRHYVYSSAILRRRWEGSARKNINQHLFELSRKACDL